MLNWIAIWVGVVPLRPRRAAPERHADVRPDLERRRRRREASGLLGRSRSPGAPRRLLRRDRRARRLLADPQPDDARLRRQGGRLQSRGGPVRRDQRLAELLPRDGDLRRVRRPRRRGRRARLAVPARDGRHPDVRRSPSSASRSRCSGATPPSASRSRRCSSAASLNGTSTRNLDPDDLQARARVEPDAAHPGPRRPLRRRRRDRAVAARRGSTGRRSAPSRRRRAAT